MNIQQTVRETLAFWHKQVADSVAELRPEYLHGIAPGSSMNTIAATYAHIVMSEDLLIQDRLRGVQPIFGAGNWDQKTGLPWIGDPPMQSPEWLAAVRVDPQSFAPYAADVFDATDAFLGSMPDADLDRTVMGLARETTAGQLLIVGVMVHFVAHAGEIAAIKGTFGMKGLPF
jgi:hypothetical protein